MAVDEHSFIVTTLERINEKLDKHDEKLDSFAVTLNKMELVMEQISNTNKRIDNVDKANNISIKRIHERADKSDEKIDKIISRQESGGCPTFRQAIPKYDAAIEASLVDRNKLSSRVEDIEKKCELISDSVISMKEKVIVANKRINDLETDQKKGLWLIVVSFIGIMVSLIKSSIG